MTVRTDEMDVVFFVVDGVPVFMVNLQRNRLFLPGLASAQITVMRTCSKKVFTKSTLVPTAFGVLSAT